MSAVDLVESREARDRNIGRTEVLDKVKALTMLPGDTYVTVEIAATYYEVSPKAIESAVFDHRVEIESDGYTVLTGERLASFKEACQIPSRAARLALFPRRAVLRLGILLRDSDVARRVRDHLLDTEQDSRAPVDELDLMQQSLNLLREQRRQIAAVQAVQAGQAAEQREIRARLDGIEGRHDWFSALAYARINNLSTERGYLQRLGTAAAQITRAGGSEPAKTQHALYGWVNTYPISALDEAWQALASP